MSITEALEKSRGRTQQVIVLGICTLGWIAVRIVVDYRHGSSWDEFILDAFLIAVLLRLWGLHKRFVEALFESVSDPVSLDRISKIAMNIEGLVILAIACALELPKWILHHMP
jgi:hypothetical protein